MPKNQLTQKASSSPQEPTSTSPSQESTQETNLEPQAPTSRQLSPAEQAAIYGAQDTPYVQTKDAIPLEDLDWDDDESWYDQKTLNRRSVTPTLRPQTRVYRIIGRNGKPTGRLAYATNEVAAAALRQEVRDGKGDIYIPAAELVDVIYDDEK